MNSHLDLAVRPLFHPTTIHCVYYIPAQDILPQVVLIEWSKAAHFDCRLSKHPTNPLQLLYISRSWHYIERSLLV